jgi:hypothetical protein
MNIHVQKVIAGGQKYWVFHEEGLFQEPFFILTDYNMDLILREHAQQSEPNK